MKKAELLRAALTAGNAWCKANPEQITVWVEKGHIQIEATGEASFMYHYTIQVLAMDFPGQVDDLMLPLLAWVWQLKRWKLAGGQAPVKPANLPVPEALDFMNDEKDTDE